MAFWDPPSLGEVRPYNLSVIEEAFEQGADAGEIIVFDANPYHRVVWIVGTVGVQAMDSDVTVYYSAEAAYAAQIQYLEDILNDSELDSEDVEIMLSINNAELDNEVGLLLNYNTFDFDDDLVAGTHINIPVTLW